MYVIHLVGGVERLSTSPQLLACVGQYVVRYAPHRSRKGRRWIWTSPNVENALKFDSIQDAQRYAMRSIGTRPDGKPDRPLTVFHLALQPEDAEPVEVP